MTGSVEVFFEHAPDHPTGAQPGPNGLWARWCKRDDCDWRETSGPGHTPTTTYLVKVEPRSGENDEAEREALDIAEDDAWLESKEGGYVATALVFAVCIFGVLLFLAAVTAGQRAMCTTHHNQLRYCASYQPTEPTR